ncbi:MAG TPA: hypothetical protein VK547_15790 [Candidatus Udaeobacter sp.]|nr:hypothetical protein [Candidatus Udaeobacter sp.]
MPSLARVFALTCALLLGAAAGAAAQGPGVLYADSLRLEWTVEPTRTGRAQVVGYLHNSNIKDAANVWLRVDQLGADGAVAGSYRRRVVGDVLSGGRSVFAVPVADAGARYRVTVETADWVKECR